MPKVSVFCWRKFNFKQTSKGNITYFTGDEIKDMESDTEWQFVTVGDQVTSMPCWPFTVSLNSELIWTMWKNSSLQLVLSSSLKLRCLIFCCCNFLHLAKFWNKNSWSGREGYCLSDVGVLCSRIEGRLCRICRGGGQNHGSIAQVLLPWWYENDILLKRILHIKCCNSIGASFFMCM